MPAGQVMALFAQLPYIMLTPISFGKARQREEFSDAIQFHPRPRTALDGSAETSEVVPA